MYCLLGRLRLFEPLIIIIRTSHNSLIYMNDKLKPGVVNL